MSDDLNDGEGFGDLDEDDVLDDMPTLTASEWDDVALLEEKMDAVNEIEDPSLRKNAAKDLVREMNGETNG
jgi:hypothetical protein